MLDGNGDEIRIQTETSVLGGLILRVRPKNLTQNSKIVTDLLTPKAEILDLNFKIINKQSYINDSVLKNVGDTMH